MDKYAYTDYIRIRPRWLLAENDPSTHIPNNNICKNSFVREEGPRKLQRKGQGCKGGPGQDFLLVWSTLDVFPTCLAFPP